MQNTQSQHVQAQQEVKKPEQDSSGIIETEVDKALKEMGLYKTEESLAQNLSSSELARHFRSVNNGLSGKSESIGINNW